jgi:PIN domain nuclease of toxin-antitoxin system
VSLLLDTHALIWLLLDSEKLSVRARDAILLPEATLFATAASAWEMATKYRLGRLPEVEYLLANFAHVLRDAAITPLMLSFEHGVRAGLLDNEHKDPFDRMIAAQAIVENLSVITIDPKIAALGARVIW